MELNEMLLRLESRYGSVSDVVCRISADVVSDSCEGQFGTEYCDGCDGHCKGHGWMD